MTTAATKLALVLTLLLSIAAVAAGSTAAASTPAARAPNPRIFFTHPSGQVDVQPFPRIRVRPLPRISSGRPQAA